MGINIRQAKMHLSRLIERVLVGEQVVVANRGLPAAQLTRVRGQAEGRKLGSAVGTVALLPGWDDPMMAEELDRFLSR